MKRNGLNERGFTLLESLFQLTVFSLFASISVLIFIWLRDIQQLQQMKQEANWEFFVYDLHQYNLNSLSGLVMNGETLRLEILNDPEDRNFIFEKSENHIRKRSNKGGNEILLPYVDQWRLDVVGNEIIMKVVMQDQSEKERVLVLPIAKQ